MIRKTLILLAEDDADDQFFISSAFEKRWPEAELIMLSNGREVLDYISGSGNFTGKSIHPPSFFILDINMPMMDGLQVLQLLRQHPEYQSHPVIVLSGAPDDLTVEKTLALGANDFISKPGKMEDYYSTVDLIRALWEMYRPQN